MVRFTADQFDQLIQVLHPDSVSPKDLPHFWGDLTKDCEVFLQKYDGYADAYRWDKRQFPLGLKRVAYKWYFANKNLDRADMCVAFRENLEEVNQTMIWQENQAKC